MLRRLRYPLIVALLIYLSTGVAQIRPDERAVVRRFGKVVARPNPGLWVGFPWGIDTLDRIPIQPRQIAIGYSPEQATDAPGPPVGQLLTADQNLVNLRLVIEYLVRSEDDQLESFLTQKLQVDPTVTREAETLAAEWIGRQPVDRVLAGRTELTLWITEQLPARLAPYRLGIRLQRVSVDVLTAPEEVRDAFEAVNQAQTGISTRENQARLEAQRYRSEAAITKQKLERESIGYHQRQIAPAEAEAAEFLKRLKQYQELRGVQPDFLAALWREEIGKLLDDFAARGGRIEVLDPNLGPDVDITLISPTRKR